MRRATAQVVSPQPKTSDRWSRRQVAAVVLAVVGALLIVAIATQLLPFATGPSVNKVRAEAPEVLARFESISDPGQAAYFAIEPSGALAVADRKQQVVRRFDAAGNPLSTWGPRVGGATLQEIAGIAVSPGAWFIVDRAGPRILKLDASGVATGEIPLAPQVPYGPSGLAADADGNLYVADTGTGRILVYSSDGRFMRAIAEHGHEVGQLNQPMAVEIGPHADMLVADWENGRVARWGADQAVSVWDVGFRPWGTAVDGAGRVYVLDPATGRIRSFTSHGTPLDDLTVPSASLNALNFATQLGVSPDGGTLYAVGHDGILRMGLVPLAESVADGAPGGLERPLLGAMALALLAVATGLAVPGARVARAWSGVVAFRRPGWRETPVRVNGLSQHRTSDSTEPLVRSPGPLGAAGWPSTAKQRRLELGCLFVILVIGLFLRAHDIEALPHGLHGDEADSGIEAQRILKDGWIGLYSPLALGRPTGPLYLTAVSVGLLGNSILAVRIIPMLMGWLTVAGIYVLARRSLGATFALLAAGTLAVMSWHIDLSRIAFHPATWGLVIVLATGALLEATRRPGWSWWWFVGGALGGLGVYMYQAAWLVLGVFGAFVGWYLLVRGLGIWRVDRNPRALSLTMIAGIACGAGVVLSTLPMALWALDPRNGYFSSFDLVSSLTKPEYTQLATVWERAMYLGGRYLLFWDRVCCHPRVDSIDGTGLSPLVPLVQLALAAVGFVVAVRWWRHPLCMLCVLFVLLAPVASVVTVDGPARRSFALVPFLALLTALGALAVIRFAARRRTVATVALAVVLFGTLGYENLHDYFAVFADSPDADHWVFTQELTDASHYMAALPLGTRVYFYADRWSVTYETSRFLAQNVVAEDRSLEFGTRQGTDIDVAHGPSSFVLIGRYRPLIDELVLKYPGGKTTYGGSTPNVTFIAYEPP